MPQEQQSYRGFEIVIDEEDNLRIDEKSIDVEKLETGVYVTSYLPYTEYTSIMELAQNVIDLAPDFYTISTDQ